MIDNVIEVKNLSKKYGDKEVLKNVSFTVKKGTIHGFVGPNGAGKSTTIEILMRALNFDKGEVWLLNKKIGESSYFNKEFGFMTEIPTFAKKLKVLNFLQLVARNRNVSQVELERRLSKSGLKEFLQKKCQELSAGWTKILLYFASTLHDPYVLIVDEPTSGLDPSHVSTILKQFENMRKKGNTILISSHILSDLQKISDSLTIINKGKIVYDGEVSDSIEKLYDKLVLDKKNRKDEEEKTWL